MGGLVGLSRREFILLGGGVASFATIAGLGLMRPRRAYAVAGIDDVVLGGLVILVATLGGYAFSRSVANVSLDALGYGFSDFVSDANNQAAAVTQAIADANNLGVELNRSNAENAAQSIAAGTGYFAEVMGDAATSGRVALDNFISGAGELPGVLRNLVGNFVSSELGLNANLLPGCVGNDEIVANAFSYDDMTVANTGTISADSISNLSDRFSLPSGSSWCIMAEYYQNGVTYSGGAYVFGNVPIELSPINGGTALNVRRVNGITDTIDYGQFNSAGVIAGPWSVESVTIGKWDSSWRVNFSFSGSLVTGSALPGVDRAVDTPDVIGPGYDSLPLSNDLVIDPSTDDVVSAGSLPLPNSIPDVFGDYVGTLNDILAGVIPGQISLPVSVAEPVVVGTAEGVQSMSITDAIAGETSLAAAINPPVGPYPPYDPVEPPVDVPEGPWTPAVSLPFELIWPFNMIYSFVELFEQLGGS